MKLFISLNIVALLIVSYLFAGCNSCEKNEQTDNIIAINSLPNIQDSITLDNYTYTPCGFHDGLACFYKGTSMENVKMGAFDRQGNIVIPSIYSSMSIFSEGHAFVSKEKFGKQAIIDKNGVLKTDFIYDETNNFSNGVAKVKLNGKYGYVNYNGNKVIDCIYDYIGDWNEEPICVKINGRSGYIDRQGKYIVRPNYSLVYRYHEGVGFVENDEGLLAAFDENGDMIMPFSNYRGTLPELSMGMVAVQCDDYNQKWGFVDKKGNIIISFQFDHAHNFGKEVGLAAIEDENGKFGFINTHGNIVIPCIYDHACFISSQCAIVKKNNKYGFIDKEGKVLLDIIYDESNWIDDGYCTIVKDGKHGIWDGNNCKLLVDCYFDFINPIYGGGDDRWPVLAIKNNKYGYLDKSGTVAIDFIYDNADNFDNGVARVELNGKEMLIDTNGRNVFER